MSTQMKVSEGTPGRKKYGRAQLDYGEPILPDASRKKQLQARYRYEAVSIIKEATSYIPDGELLWCGDDAAQSENGKQVILEQIGRMALQDRYQKEQCILFANLAIQALKNGATCRKIMKAIIAVRLAIRKYEDHPDDEQLRVIAVEAVHELKKMGGMED